MTAKEVLYQYKVSPRDLVSLIDFVSPCRGAESKNYVLSGCLFVYNEVSITAVCADGRRLGRIVIESDFVSSGEHPSRASEIYDISPLVKMRHKLSTRKASEVQVERLSDGIRFTFNNGAKGDKCKTYDCFCPTLDGRFPNWELCFPKVKSTGEFQVPAADWGGAWTKYKEASYTGLNVNPSGGLVTCETPKLRLPSVAGATGEPYAGCLDMNLLFEFLSKFPADKWVTVKHYGVFAPILIEFENRLTSSTVSYLLMPVSTEPITVSEAE